MFLNSFSGHQLLMFFVSQNYQTLLEVVIFWTFLQSSTFFTLSTIYVFWGCLLTWPFPTLFTNFDTSYPLYPFNTFYPLYPVHHICVDRSLHLFPNFTWLYWVYISDIVLKHNSNINEDLAYLMFTSYSFFRICFQHYTW